MTTSKPKKSMKRGGLTGKTFEITPEAKRRAMQANRGRTRPEMRLARALWHRGLRYLTATGYRSRYGWRLVGAPDLVFPSKRIVVFVDGCFWHGCPICKGIPQESGEFWKTKIERNRDRDVSTNRRLSDEGWCVFRVWEHEVRNQQSTQRTADRIVRLVEEATA